MQWIESNGAVLRYELAGNGPRTIVLIHEMGGTLESWSDVVPKLVGAYRVLRYDTRGAGLSEKVRGALSIDTMADDVAGLLDALKIGGKVAIAGIAVGGAIAIHFAARHAARTAALVAMSPAVGIAPERRAATSAIADEMERRGVRPGMAAALDLSYPLAMRGDTSRFETVRAQRLGNDPASQAAVYRMLLDLDMRAAFRHPMSHAGAGGAARWLASARGRGACRAIHSRRSICGTRDRAFHGLAGTSAGGRDHNRIPCRN